MPKKRRTDSECESVLHNDFRLAVLSSVCFLFCGSLSNLNSNSGVSTVNSLNGSGGYCIVGSVNSYNLLGSNYCIGIYGLGLLVAVAGNHSNAEQNSERKNYFLHFSLN